MLDVFLNDPIALTLLSGLLFIFASCLAFVSIKRYEFAILLIILSPWLSVMFIPNTAELYYSDRAATLGSYMRISVLILGGLVGIVSFFKFRRHNNNAILPQYILLGLFLLIALISTVYSIEREITFIRSVSFILFFLFLLGFGSWLDNDEKIQSSLNIIFWIFAVIISLNLIALLLLPREVWFLGMSRFKGLWDHPNSMGGLCMVCYPIFVYKYFNAGKNLKWIVVLLLLSTAAMHLLTGSRTTLLSSAFGLFVLFFIARRRFSIVFLIVLVSLAAITFSIYKPSGLTRGGSLSNFSGRLKIWTASLELVQERPLLGYGYGVGGAVFDDPRFYEEELFLWQGSARVSLHNGYFSIAISAGLAGFAIFFCSLLLPFVKSFKILDVEMKALMVSILTMCLVTNFTESYIGGPSNIGALVLWILWGIAGQKYRAFYARAFS